MVKEIETIQIDWNTLSNLQDCESHYDKATDTLLIQSKEARPAVSVDCDGDFWIRVDPHSGEILGVEIEDFKKVFLKRYAKLFKGDDIYIRPVANIIQMEKCPA
ncbi:DUF2283 domain-containing protein [Chloroflexota bacterium]